MVGWTRRIHTDGKETQKKDAEREIGGKDWLRDNGMQGGASVVKVAAE